MQTLPSVSVVLATYNGARFLGPQLESLNLQTHRPTELIIGDDCSTDETIALVRAFQERAAFPVRFTVNEKRLHFGENFLTHALASKSKYVAFCDQDDVWLPEKLERCIRVLEETGAVLCGHDAELINSDGQRIGPFRQIEGGEFEPLSLSPWGVFFGFTMVFCRDLLDVIPPVSRGRDNIDCRRRLAHDRWIYFLGQTFGKTIYLNEPLVLYRQHTANLFGASYTTKRPGRITLPTLTAPSYFQHHLAICYSRASMLRSLGKTAGASTAALAIRGARYWEKLAKLYEMRLAIVSGRAFSSRVGALHNLIKSSAYAPYHQGGLSGRALVRDLSNLLGSALGFKYEVQDHT